MRRRHLYGDAPRAGDLAKSERQKFGSEALDYLVVATYPDSGVTLVEAKGISAFGPIPMRVVGYGGWLTHN